MATKVLAMAAAAAVLASSAQFAGAVAATPANGAPFEPVTANFVDQLAHQGQSNGPTLLRFSGREIGGLYGGLVDGLALRDKDVRVDQGLGFQFGYGRVGRPGSLPVWYVVEDSPDFSLLSTQPGAKVLVQSHPLSAREQAELVALQKRILDELSPHAKEADFRFLGRPLVAFEMAHALGVTPAQLSRLATLNVKVANHTCLCAVIAFRTGSVPSWAYVPGRRTR